MDLKPSGQQMAGYEWAQLSHDDTKDFASQGWVSSQSGNAHPSAARLLDINNGNLHQPSQPVSALNQVGLGRKATGLEDNTCKKKMNKDSML